MDTPHWIKSKRETINSINKNDNKYFQYPVTVSSNHRKISKHPERISQIMPFADKCNWKGINYPPGKDNQKKIQKKNLKIAFNILYNMFFISNQVAKGLTLKMI